MNEQAFRLRPATAEDAADIKALIRQSGINPMGLDWPRFVLAVDAQDEMIGCVQLKPHHDGSVELASLAVASQWRGRGLARVLIEHMLAQHPGRLYLMCRAGLGSLYEKFGFQSLEIEEMPPYFRRIARLVDFLGVLRPTSEGLLVMRRA
jgi:N-acetylglutamate synthase-like GNAT family acetyltransferase